MTRTEKKYLYDISESIRLILEDYLEGIDSLAQYEESPFVISQAIISPLKTELLWEFGGNQRVWVINKNGMMTKSILFDKDLVVDMHAKMTNSP